MTPIRPTRPSLSSLDPGQRQQVDFDVAVHEEYWEAGVAVVPPIARARASRLEQYYEIVRGNISDIGLDAIESSVVLDMPAEVVNFYEDFIMSRPPIVNGLPDDYDLDDFYHSLRRIVRDRFIAGTGVLWVPPVTDGEMPYVTHLDPREWYPTQDYGGDVVRRITPLASAAGDRPHEFRVEVWRFAGATHDYRSFVGGTEHQIGLLESEAPIEAEYRPVFPVAREPAVDGEWGRSIVEDLFSGFRELTKRFSQNSLVIDKHAEPVLAYRHKENWTPSSVNRRGETPAETQIAAQQETEDLVLSRKSGVLVYPEHIDGAEYIESTSGLETSFEQIERIEERLYAMVHLPATLRGLHPGGFPSGEAYRQAHRSTIVSIDQLQLSIVGAAQDAFALAGYDVEVIWPNPFDSFAAGSPRSDLIGHEVSTGQAMTEGKQGVAEESADSV